MMYETKKQKKPIKATLGAIIIVFVAVGIFVSDYYRDNYLQNNPTTNSELNTQPNIKTLGITPKAYGDAFNEEVEGTNLQSNDWDSLDVNLNEASLNEASQNEANQNKDTNSFTITYPNGLILTANINKKGELSKLLYTESATKQANEENVPLIKLATAVGRTLHPQVSKRDVNKQIKTLVTDVGIDYAQTKTPQRKSIEFEGNIYTFEMSDEGLALTVEPASVS